VETSWELISKDVGWEKRGKRTCPRSPP
jgi:hypothetical protein